LPKLERSLELAPTMASTTLREPTEISRATPLCFETMVARRYFGAAINHAMAEAENVLRAARGSNRRKLGRSGRRCERRAGADHSWRPSLHSCAGRIVGCAAAVIGRGRCRRSVALAAQTGSTPDTSHAARAGPPDRR
jgi:hypothetical protein